MKTAIIEIQGLAPLSGSRNHGAPKKEGESHADYDARTWRDKMHAHPDGRCYVPGIALKFALDWTTQQLGMKIQGRGNKTWASIFAAGVLCPEPIDLLSPAPSRALTSNDVPDPNRKVPVMKDVIEGVNVYCDATGRRGSSSKVWRRFPIVHQWSGMATFLIVNDEITETIFRHHLEMCGRICGLGRYRAQKGGEFGRFRLTAFEWQDEAKLKAA